MKSKIFSSRTAIQPVRFISKTVIFLLMWWVITPPPCICRDHSAARLGVITYSEVN